MTRIAPAVLVLLLGLVSAAPRGVAPTEGISRRGSDPAQTRGGAAGLTDEGLAVDEVVKFRSMDVFVDSGARPLAAYQFNFLVHGPTRVDLVGVEGGAHPAFAEPPYYDPQALAHRRVVIAAFNTGDNLPRGRTKVATLHLRVTGAARLQAAAGLQVAASPDGQPIPDASISVSEVTPVPEGDLP